MFFFICPQEHLRHPTASQMELELWIVEMGSEVYFCANHPRLLLESVGEIKIPYGN